MTQHGPEDLRRSPGGLPFVAVAASRTQPGVDQLDDQAPPLELLSFRTAFERLYKTDAHFVCYQTTGTGMTAFPRLNKPVLSKLQAAGGEAWTTLLAFDYDTPGHKPWTPETYEAFAGTLAELQAQGLELATDWTLLYLTRKGARFVYVLSRAIPAGDAEPLILGAINTFTAYGLPVDPQPNSWNNLFRLPAVIRDDDDLAEPTWEDPFYELLWQEEKRLDPKTLPAAEKIVAAQVARVDIGQPDQGEALELLWEDRVDGRGKRTSKFYKTAKKKLRGRDCWACIFASESIANEGSRETTIHSYAGQCVAVLYRVEDCTPDHIFALLLDPVLELEPDRGTKDWTKTLWRSILKCWAQEQRKEQERELRAFKRASDAQELMGSVLTGYREWSDAPELERADADAAEWVMERLIVSVGKDYHVLRGDGRYDPMPVLRDQLIPRIRSLGMDLLMPLQIMSGETIRPVSTTELVNKHATIARSTYGCPGITGAELKNPDTERAELRVGIYRRKPHLIPAWDDRVDSWLRLLFGNEDYPKAMKWIGHALAFEDGPICALSIAGPPGCGKKMLMQGLAECLDTETMGGAEDLTSAYQYGLTSSCFVWINEGWTAGRGGKHPADTFRELVSGDPFWANRKYMAPMRLATPARVVFTANNTDVVRVLCGDRELSPEDRQALSIRLYHVRVTGNASRWLESIGGMRATRGWIRGDGGEASNYVVARHFLWLHAHRGKALGRRFLVEGSAPEELLFEMRARGGITQLVIEAILKMLQSNTPVKGLAVEDGKLYVLTSAILEYYRRQFAGTASVKLTAHKIAKVMRGLIKHSGGPRLLASRPDEGRVRWHELEAELLLSVAEQDGWRCPKLRQLVEGARVSTMQEIREAERKRKQG